MKNVNGFPTREGDETFLNSTSSNKRLEINNSKEPLLSVAQRKDELDKANSQNTTHSSKDLASNSSPNVSAMVKMYEQARR